MSTTSITGEHNPVGHNVDQLLVLGEEHDGEDHWVAADILLDVRPVGSFFLRIVTKQHFLNEKIEETFSSEQLEKLLEKFPEAETKPPFVLNDSEISNEVLEREFVGRIVEQALAESLWPMA